MTPDQSAVAERFEPLARKLAGYHRWRFRDDRDLAVEVALEALCEAAIRHAEVERFEGYLATMVEARCIDEARRRYGRHPGSARRAILRQRSLDVPATDAASATFADLLPDGDDGAAFRVVDLVDLVDRTRLTDRERDIVLGTAHGASLGELGERWGVTESRVCQILAWARAKLTAADAA